MFHSRPFLAIECLLLFGVLPGLLIIGQLHGGIPFFPILLGMMLLTLLLGARDKDLRFRFPGSWQTARAFLPKLGVRVLLVALFLLALTFFARPDLLFRLPRENLFLWWMIMLLYPLLSVVPQEYLFRIYFMQRYRPLFGDGRLMRWVNALAFGWAHAFMLNWIAPLLSAAAGYLFADTWQRTRNLRAVWLEHALYGQIVFTVGLGWFFYNGSARALETLTP